MIAKEIGIYSRNTVEPANNVHQKTGQMAVMYRSPI